MSETILSVRDLTTRFGTVAGTVTAVDRVSFDVAAGETLAIVGESGCGKSVTALSIMRLLPGPPISAVTGSVRLGDRDLLSLRDGEMEAVRGRDVAMIFQEPLTSLNPVFTVGDQIAEAIQTHTGAGRRAALAQARDLLDLVRIPDAARRLHEYPHRLSGGMRQRVMIAMAIACRPRLLIADEPTTALDVTVQAQILDLLRDLQRQLGMAMVLITHDLGVVAETARRVVVMYAGRVVEESPVRDLFRAPAHPYTQGLLRASPHAAVIGAGKLIEIPGMVPGLASMPSGCAFAPRCPRAEARCAAEAPPLERHAPERTAACWFATVAEPAEAVP